MDAHKVSAIVMHWLYFKANLKHIGFAHPDNAFGPHDTPDSVLRQIAADAGHSFLLQRMLAGYDPLPQEEYDAWKARNFEGWLGYLESRTAMLAAYDPDGGSGSPLGSTDDNA